MGQSGLPGLTDPDEYRFSLLGCPVVNSREGLDKEEERYNLHIYYESSIFAHRNRYTIKVCKIVKNRRM